MLKYSKFLLHVSTRYLVGYAKHRENFLYVNVVRWIVAQIFPVNKKLWKLKLVFIEFEKNCRSNENADYTASYRRAFSRYSEMYREIAVRNHIIYLEWTEKREKIARSQPKVTILSDTVSWPSVPMYFRYLCISNWKQKFLFSTIFSSKNRDKRKICLFHAWKYRTQRYLLVCDMLKS